MQICWMFGIIETIKYIQHTWWTEYERMNIRIHLFYNWNKDRITNDRTNEQNNENIIFMWIEAMESTHTLSLFLCRSP